ncbi:hypothetical protein Tco_1456811 [Tanacetum coccineum]
MNSTPNYKWEQLLDIDDFDLPLTLILRPCNNHAHETTTTTTTQNHDVDNLEEKLVRIIPGLAGIVQVVKLRKQLDIHQGGDKSLLSTSRIYRTLIVVAWSWWCGGGVRGDDDGGCGGVERVMVAGRWMRWRDGHRGGDVYGGGVVVMRLWVMMVVDLWCGSGGGWLESGRNLAGKR